MIIRRCFAAGLFAAACSFTAFAQGVPGSFVPARFVSVEGGFRIDLPARTDESVRPVAEMAKGAGSFTWRVGEGTFTVGFVEGISVKPVEGFKVLGELAASVDAVQQRAGARVVDKCEFSFDGFPGIEVRVVRPGGIHAVNRFIIAGQRLYILTADWPAAMDESIPRGILDSFELADTRAFTA